MEELKTLKRQVADQEDLIDSLRRKEQRLMADQKKRSEAARELVEAKVRRSSLNRSPFLLQTLDTDIKHSFVVLGQGDPRFAI